MSLPVNQSINPPGLRGTATRDRLRQYLTQGYQPTARVAEQCGVTLRQLQWWDEQGYLTPVQIGHTRMYSPEQIDHVRKIAALRKAGVSLQIIRARKLLDQSFRSVVKARKAPVLIGGVLVVGR